MNKKEKQPYEAPSLTVVAFRSERGYAMSMTFDAVLFNALATDNGTMEAARTDYGNGGNSEWNF